MNISHNKKGEDYPQLKEVGWTSIKEEVPWSKKMINFDNMKVELKKGLAKIKKQSNDRRG